jgi:hypothetical protein
MLLTRRKISSSLLIRSSSSCDASSAMTWHLMVAERIGGEVFIVMHTCPKSGVAKVSPYLDSHLASCRRMGHPLNRNGSNAESGGMPQNKIERDAKQGAARRTCVPVHCASTSMAEKLKVAQFLSIDLRRDECNNETVLSGCPSECVDLLSLFSSADNVCDCDTYWSMVSLTQRRH